MFGPAPLRWSIVLAVCTVFVSVRPCRADPPTPACFTTFAYISCYGNPMVNCWYEVSNLCTGGVMCIPDPGAFNSQFCYWMNEYGGNCNATIASLGVEGLWCCTSNCSVCTSSGCSGSFAKAPALKRTRLASNGPKRIAAKRQPNGRVAKE